MFRLCLALCVFVLAGSASAGEVSKGLLAKKGLSGLKPMPEAQAQEVRGKAFTYPAGWPYTFPVVTLPTFPATTLPTFPSVPLPTFPTVPLPTFPTVPLPTFP